MRKPSLSCAVLFSGAGTTARALLDYVASSRGCFQIDLLVTNNPLAPGIALAAHYGTEVLVLPDSDNGKPIPRQQWDMRLQQRLAGYKIDVILLAGFMRILGKTLVERWLARMINIHPSLLPQYPGLNTHQRVLQAGERTHGFSIHLVTPELDAGPVLAHCKVAVERTDTPDSLRDKVQQKERYYYPRVIELIASQRLHLSIENPQFDGRTLPTTGIALCDTSFV